MVIRQHQVLGHHFSNLPYIVSAIEQVILIVTIAGSLQIEKMLCTSHNALLLMGYRWSRTSLVQRVQFLAPCNMAKHSHQVTAKTQMRLFVCLDAQTTGTKLCPISRLDAMSLLVGCVLQASNQLCKNMHILWLLTVKYAIYLK